MTTLQIRNRVRDFDQWKAAFDQFDRFRRDNGVRAYRVCRDREDPGQVEIVLEFDDLEAAAAFRTQLLKVWQTPRSRAQLIDHEHPRILEVVEQRTIRPVA
jgi:heme-degrading monooxygenase HmoA